MLFALLVVASINVAVKGTGVEGLDFGSAYFVLRPFFQPLFIAWALYSVGFKLSLRNDELRHSAAYVHFVLSGIVLVRLPRELVGESLLEGVSRTPGSAAPAAPDLPAAAPGQRKKSHQIAACGRTHDEASRLPVFRKCMFGATSTASSSGAIGAYRRPPVDGQPAGAGVNVECGSRR